MPKRLVLAVVVSAGCSGSTMSMPPPGPVGFDDSDVATLAASNGLAGDLFGSSIAISGDGNTVAIGAPAATEFGGEVYVFTRQGSGAFVEDHFRAADTTASDNFGWSVALSQDGLTLAVGATGRWDLQGTIQAQTGTAYVFVRGSAAPGVAWTQQGELIPDPSTLFGGGEYAGNLGASVSLSDDGSELAVGEPNYISLDTFVPNQEWGGAGAAHVYARGGSGWSEVALVTPSVVVTSNAFGFAVSLSGDGALLAVGAPGEASVATGIDQLGSDASVPGAGAAYLFAPDASGAWHQQHYIKPQQAGTGEANFGHAVALSRDGATLAIGAPGQASNAVPQSGAAYVLALGSDGATWAQQATLATDPALGSVQLGNSVALAADGSTLVAGAELAQDGADPGAVLTATLGSDGPWTVANPLVYGPVSSPGDAFGAAVALDDDAGVLATGAPSQLMPGPNGTGDAYVYEAVELAQ